MSFPNTVELAALGRRRGASSRAFGYGSAYPVPVGMPLLFEETPAYVEYMRDKCQAGSQDARCGPIPLSGLGDGESEWIHTGDYILAVQAAVDEMLDGAQKDALQNSLDAVKALHHQSGGKGGFFGIGLRPADFVNDPALWAKEYKWMTDQLRAIERTATKTTGRFAFASGTSGLGSIEDSIDAILVEIRKLTVEKKPQQANAAVKALGDYIEGLGATNSAYSNWYYTQYLPNYYSQQYQQQCPAGYTMQTSANGTRTCVPQQAYNQQYAYPMSQYYTPGYGYGYNNPSYAANPQQCAAQGGLFDSFSNTCSSSNQGQQYYGQAYGASPQQCAGQGGLWDSFSGQCSVVGAGVSTSVPNVIGVAKWTAVQMLNNAGYTVWLSAENGISQGTPADWQTKRVRIVVNNGVVTQSQIG